MRAAEEDDFRRFVEASSPALLRLAFLLTSDWGAAEDLLQIALFRTYRKWRLLRLEDPTPYVRRVMINASISGRRRRRVREVPLVEFHDDAVPADVGSVEVSMTLAAILATLPARQRAVVALRYCLDLSEVDVAELLGCSVGTVKSQASKAIRTLRQQPRLRWLSGLAEETT